MCSSIMVCRSVISEAKALLQDGFRETLAPFDELEAYWATILQDFPKPSFVLQA